MKGKGTWATVTSKSLLESVSLDENEVQRNDRVIL